MNSYKTTVGIEVHAELKTKSKMFCGCKNDPHASQPNVNVCPVCMAHPGTLPVVNKEAVHFLMQVGTAIGGELAEYSEFDRKNYFYPDIPKAYQISQYKFPFVTGGELAGVAITRIHLEEDTARSQHEDDTSLVDFNRAGVPLMELVTEPVIHDPESAGAFTRELQLLLRTLKVSDANMERGEMRVEANISVSKTNELGTKVEVKNLNSFKAMEAAIAHEVQRHIEVLEAGGELVQETRGWDENRSKTFSQRMKESADDYRYFPDPDIPKFKRSEIPEFSNTRLSEIIPETPTDKRIRYQELGLAEDQIQIIISEIDRDIFFSSAVKALKDTKDIGNLANYFVSDLLGLCEANELQLENASAVHFSELVSMIGTGELTSRVAKDLLREVVFDGQEPQKIAKERGLLQQNSEDDLIPIVDKVLAENNDVVAEYKAGKDAAIQFLVGQCMKATRGSANPGVLVSVIKKRIG
ncbi:MAG: aspartyl-tRNA(Asn)/glutamyl-tRNA(Gln) amidotransferase subunit B [Acidimicrobiales bacterium]|jgi:aspartyl-tRNA(Asn)/glutamyl-tRNA(Gln) amidotransferase subunit B